MSDIHIEKTQEAALAALHVVHVEHGLRGFACAVALMRATIAVAKVGGATEAELTRLLHAVWPMVKMRFADVEGGPESGNMHVVPDIDVTKPRGTGN